MSDNSPTPPPLASSTPGDLHQLSDWLPIARRLRQVAIQHGSPAVLRLTLLIDENGFPRLYAIRSTKIEPKARVEDVIEWLAGDDPTA